MVYLKGQQLYITIRNAQSITRRYLEDYWQQRCRIIEELKEVIDATVPAWETESFSLFVMRCVRPSFTNIAYGFGKVSPFKSLNEFRTIVCDSRVRQMCIAMDGSGLNDEWNKLFHWCKSKQWITLYLYYMDVQHGSKICHCIRRVQKAIVRRLKKHPE